MVIDKDLEILKDLDNYIIFKIPKLSKISLENNLTFYDKFKDKFKNFILDNFKADINSIYSYNRASYEELIDRTITNPDVLIQIIKNFYEVCERLEIDPKDNILIFINMYIQQATSKKIIKNAIIHKKDKLVYVLEEA